MRTKQSKSRSKTIVGIFLLALACTGVSYYYFIIIPKQELQHILTEFEIASRNQNISKLHAIVSKESAIYEHLPDNMLKELFGRFEPDIKVTSAKYVPAYGLLDQSMILGEAEMLAKKDGNKRVFDQLLIQKYNGTWKISQFGFPDLINY